MKSLLNRLFTPSVDKVLAVFNKALTALAKVEQYHADQAAVHAQVAVDAAAHRAKHEIELSRARSVARKLEDLLR